MAAGGKRPGAGRKPNPENAKPSSSPLVLEVQDAYAKLGKPSVDDLADKAGVSRSALYDLLYSGRAPRTIDWLDRLFKAMGFRVVLTKRTPSERKGGAKRLQD